MFLSAAESVPEALVVNHFAFPQEADRIGNVGVVDQAEQIVIGHAGFLLGGEILVQIGENVTFHGECAGAERRTVGALRINAGGVIGEIGGKGTVCDLFFGKIRRQLVQDRPHDFQMREFLGAYRCIKNGATADLVGRAEGILFPFQHADFCGPCDPIRGKKPLRCFYGAQTKPDGQARTIRIYILLK